MSDPTNPAPRAVLAALRELAAGTGECVATIAQLGDLAELGRTHTRSALHALELAGEITIERSAGGVTPSRYRLVTGSLGTVTPSTPTSSDPVTPGEVTPSTVAHARDRSEPSSSLSASGNGDRRARPPAPARARLPTPDQEHPMPDPTPNPEAPAQTAIIAAVKACETMGKPPLDDAAKKRIGSVAKRMHKGGVTLVELQSAAVYLVQRGMSDLQAAHRGRLEQDAKAIAGDELAERAAASYSARAEQRRHPITLEELAEAWLLMRQQWPRIALPPASDAGFWVAELEPVPIEFVLEALRRWAQRTDGQGAFPPTPGQVRVVSRKLFGDAILYAKGRAIIAEDDRLAAEHKARQDARAAGDASDPREV